MPLTNTPLTPASIPAPTPLPLLPPSSYPPSSLTQSTYATIT